MKSARVQSICECQAQLFADLDEGRRVLRGWVKDRRGREYNAPANSMRIEQVRFDVGWLCPVCTRNTLRSFDVSTLFYKDAEPDRASGAPLG
jgi:hypothetical protein